MKKLFTLIVAICATTLAWADRSGSCGENVTYSLVSSTGTLTISGTGDMNNYRYLDDRPWYYWSGEIKKVVINNGVTSVGERVFEGCTGLTSITIGNDVTSIGKYAFKGCTGLTSVTIPNSVTSIGSSAFSLCEGLTSVTIPNSVTSVGELAFNGCSGLTSITIGNGVTSIGNYAFNGCDNIETADISSQAALNAIAFTDKLTSIILGDGITSIRYKAFEDCTGLTSVTIPNSVTSIKDFAFKNCTGLTSIEIPNSVTSIKNSAFDGCTGLTSINVAEDNSNYASIDGVLYSKDKKTLKVYPLGKTGSFTIPNGVTSIGGGAFEDCTGLTSVEIPNSVTSIGSNAFYNCNGLTSMTVEATTPPSASYSIVSKYNIPLYVPAGSVDAYKAANEWKKFTNIQAIPGTGVNEATVENTVEKSVVKKIIDRNGIIYIEKDGTRYFLNGSKVK